ncbi:GLUT4 regulating protein TUG-domain-containing protein [Ampelomyces quisqualis]|uniref:GLUT4 regulating protein TUG-domain-containing protein n=1 Tax=Ampelomyces quisqualis TaxID=50730 RepID=A0A6A5QXN0_AMPQU|nr:GLUT4 regulating protein TUG-domain-containing protein [Ampelomyces quisqualis]
MSHVVVFNSYAKTVRVLTTPVTYLTEVRDEACQKFGVSKDQFTLKYNNKPVSLSQQIRLANLPQGARLELVQTSRSPTVVSVALQLPPSEKRVRLIQKFASNTSLWEILRHFESGEGVNYNFTQRGVPEMSGASGAGRLHYEIPVITVMPSHREQSDFVGLQQSLAQLGFDSGSALLKLSYKNSGLPLEEAMAQISQYFKNDISVTDGAHEAHGATSAQEASQPVPVTAAPEAATIVVGETIPTEEPGTESMEVDTSSSTPLIEASEILAEGGTVQNVGDISSSTKIEAATTSTTSGPQIATLQEDSQPRNVQIFSAPTSSIPQAARNAFNESDYLPTIEHAKVHQAQLLSKTRNTRLLSDKELEEQEKARQEKVDAAAARGGALRIRMPDGSLIQMNFSKDDTADILYDFVQSFLDRKNEPFELKYTSPTGRLILIEKNSKRLSHDLRFSLNELITFQWAENASAQARASRSTLAKEWQAKATALKVEEPAPEEKFKVPAQGQTVAEGKRKAGMSSEDKESKLKSMLGKTLFKRK